MMWFLVALAYFTIGALIATIVAYVQKRDPKNRTDEIVDSMVLVFFCWPFIIVFLPIIFIIFGLIFGIMWVFKQIVKSLPE